MSESRSIKIRLRDLLKLKRYADRHDLNDKEALGVAIEKLEVKPLKSELEGKMICCECDSEISDICKFCPNCGAEFEIVVEADSLEEALDKIDLDDEDEEEDEDKE